MKESQPKRPNKNLLRDKKGSLSITALWILALLSLLATGLMRNVLVGLRLDGYALRAAQATWLARAGIYHAIAVLKEDADTDSLRSYDALTETWAHSPDLFKRVPCGNGFFEVAYATQAEDIGLKYLYGICDENRKLNINRIPKEVLMRLPSMTQEKVAALLDWRDRDSKTTEGGAENPYYQHLLQPYPCKNADFDFVEEMALVRGFSDEDVRALAHLVTVHGDGGVNINTASAEVLAILGLNAKLAKKIAKVRWGEDGLPFTKDDVVFRNQDDIVTILTKLIKLKPTDQALLHRLVTTRQLGVNSTHFTIHSVGVTMHGQVRKKISATVLRLNAQEVEILTWTEQSAQ